MSDCGDCDCGDCDCDCGGCEGDCGDCDCCDCGCLSCDGTEECCCSNCCVWWWDLLCQPIWHRLCEIDCEVICCNEDCCDACRRRRKQKEAAVVDQEDAELDGVITTQPLKDQSEPSAPQPEETEMTCLHKLPEQVIGRQ